jgi:hypothetical protein
VTAGVNHRRRFKIASGRHYSVSAGVDKADGNRSMNRAAWQQKDTLMPPRICGRLGDRPDFLETEAEHQSRGVTRRAGKLLQ